MNKPHRGGSVTPDETADFLRRFNAWRRGGSETMPDPLEIGHAIDVAVERLDETERLRAQNAVLTAATNPAAITELLDRLEAAERERDALRARIEAMERQEPVAWMLNCPTLGGDTGWILSWTQSGAGLCNRLQGEENEKKLYALPGAQAQPAPGAPDSKTIRDLLNESGLHAYGKEGDLAFMVAVTKFAALAALAAAPAANTPPGPAVQKQLVSYRPDGNTCIAKVTPDAFSSWPRNDLEQLAADLYSSIRELGPHPRQRLEHHVMYSAALGAIAKQGSDSKPAPSVPDVDALAQFIREIDGDNRLGAGALAERIVEWLAAAPESTP